MPPAKTESSKGLTKGDLLEARVAQLWFWEGYYSRSGIDLRQQFFGEQLVVTDLDLLAFDFSPTLDRSKIIGEVKSGTGKNAPKPLDRIVWLRGLRDLVDGDRAELTITAKLSSKARELAVGLGVRAQSERDIERREMAAGVRNVADLGSQGPKAVQDQKLVQAHCAKDRDLERAYWFLRSQVWFLDEVTAAKRLIGLYSQLAQRWTPEIDDEDAKALRWLFAESVSIFTLNVVSVAAQAIIYDTEHFSARIGERLSSGTVSAEAMRRISADVDKFIGGVLVAANASTDVRADAIGALHPEPPNWTEQFLELVQRLAKEPLAARLLPRQVDLLAFERLTRRRNVEAGAAARMGLDDRSTGRLIRLVGAFLRSQAGDVSVVDRALSTPVEFRAGDSPHQRYEGGSEQSLFSLK